MNTTLSTSRKDMGRNKIIARAVNKEPLQALKDSKVKKHNMSLEQLTQQNFFNFNEYNGNNKELPCATQSIALMIGP